MLNQIDQTAPWGQVDELAPTGFFADAYQFFQGVSHKVGGALNKFYNLHGHLIRLSFAGPALTKITPALEHWEVAPEGAPPELTVCLWDDISTNTNMPPPPWLGYWAYTRRGEVRGYNTDRIRTAFQMGSDVLNILDLQRGLALYWTRDATHLPQWELGSPLRIIFHWWLRQAGLQYVHAGAVGRPEAGVLLVGKGGSGKSTTSLTCLNSELKYVSDDYCLISTDPVAAAHNLYNTGKVRVDNIHRVPHLKPFISNMDKLDQDKALFSLNNQHFSDKLSPGFPLKALFIPRVTGRLETSLSPARAADGLSALTLSTMAQLPGAGPAALQIINQLVQQIPSYFLELGTDLSQIPVVILDFLTS